MTDQISIQVDSISKNFLIYDKPFYRLLQMIIGSTKNLFKEHAALRNVSFSVTKGQTVGIIGRNGSGKSTLLQIICGTLSASAGSVSADGRIAALLELGSGFNPEFTGLENIYMSGQVLGLTNAEIDARVDSIIAFSEIEDKIHQPVKTYSSGMFMRLAFSVIAHVEAQILVIDEALAVGDAYFVQKCMRFLDDFKKKGGTLLLVSHDSTAITTLCDKVVWLENGSLRAIGDAKTVTQEYLKDYYSKQQSVGSVDDVSIARPRDRKNFVDPRQALLKHSTLRNDLQIFSPENYGNRFGNGAAKISNVSLISSSGEPLLWAIGGESVSLVVRFETYEVLKNLIVGFIVKNKNGVSLFGDNTCLTYFDDPKSSRGNEVWDCRFDFDMPILPAGDYSITVAVSDGTQDNHRVNDWVDDAVIIRSESMNMASGLIGIPMREIEMVQLEGELIHG
ncbi:ABC transporter ATP-binding protein [Pseudomonas sp. L1(2025)]|uniref:ABC transporter ATP-binding protein n=1 Tax=Pseudomonas sp. L1(2025) TaxID=3449429 RepID=UPI003F69019C